jgi:predicted nucleic acid-binding Zn ribbon protein
MTSPGPDGGSAEHAGGSNGRGPQRRDPRIEAMQARHSDLDQATLARHRARDRRRRAARDRAAFDPAPPGDDDATIGDRSQVVRLHGQPEPLGDVLADVLGRRQWAERMQSVRVFARWEQVVGADVARNCDPVRLVGGVLVVAAASPSWATQLRYLAPQLALSVNRAIGEPVVDRVEVTVRR